MYQTSTTVSPFPEWFLWLLPAGAVGILLVFFASSAIDQTVLTPDKAVTGTNLVYDAITRRPLTEAFRMADKEFRMGEVFRQRRQFSEALSFYRDALRIDPTHVEALDRTGFCLWKQKDLIGAEQAFTKALSTDPGFYRSQFYLGRIYRDTQQWKEALGALAKAWNQSPKRDFIVGFEYAELLFQLGMFPEAIDLLGELRSKFPSNSHAEALRIKVLQAQDRR